METIWPTSSVPCRREAGSAGVLPLRTFIQETLRRSKTSYSALQVALYYLVLIKSHVPHRDFTMEQPDDCYASRAIQCGRRMFLAALILSSKYLQDRNYSARAWSKISGLNVQEINQNEMAFLLAINWKLHITEEVYNRWIECVMRFTPSQPPSPGGSAAQRVYLSQCDEFRTIILKLTPDLENLDDLTTSWTCDRLLSRHSLSNLTLFTPTSERISVFGHDAAMTPTSGPYSPLAVMEPNPNSVVCTPGRLAPALGLLPTPRLTPQNPGYCTPAVSAVSQPGKSSWAGLVMAQAGNVNVLQSQDRWLVANSTSPQSHVTRRSSLVNSLSTASSPESMVSDTSQTSRSSSISSASSLASAPSSRVDVLARCRYAKHTSERMSLMPTILSIPEDYEEKQPSSSPDSYPGTVGKDSFGLSMETLGAQRPGELDEAARALQDLHHYGRSMSTTQTAAHAKAGVKRGRTLSIDKDLQDNVRNLLASHRHTSDSSWPTSLVRCPYSSTRDGQFPAQTTSEGARKRVCCSAEAGAPYMVHLSASLESDRARTCGKGP